MNSRIDGPANYAAAGPAVRECEIPKVLAALFQELERYDHVAGRLGDRLQPIMSPSSPQVAGEGKPEREFQTALAGEIHQANCRLRNITDGLDMMLQRIEL